MKLAADKLPTTHGSKPVAKSDIDGQMIALQLLDVSWRVALPIIIFSYAGIRLDKHLHTNPLYTLIGFFVSLVLATLLVYKQLKRLYPDMFGKGKAK